MDQNQQVISKIAKLLRLAEGKGTTPSEAANAAAAAQALMDRHKLTRAAVETDERQEGAPGEPIGRADQPLVRASKLVRWKRELASGVARVNQCRILLSAATRGVPDSGRISLVGRESDIAVVRYLFAYLVREIERLAKEAVSAQDFLYVGEARVWGTSFRRGAVSTVVRRLREARDAARREAQEEVANQHGASASSRALVLVQQHDKDVQRFVEKGWKSHYQGGRPSVDADGVAAGVAAGQRIPIRSALDKGAPVPALKE